MEWDHDRETGWHTLAVPGDDDAFVFVYRTPAGDYAISAMREGEASGGAVDYRDTLAQAKRHAETLVNAGTWTLLTIDSL